jgi:hypothetical protein
MMKTITKQQSFLKILSICFLLVFLLIAFLFISKGFRDDQLLTKIDSLSASAITKINIFLIVENKQKQFLQIVQNSDKELLLNSIRHREPVLPEHKLLTKEYVFEIETNSGNKYSFAILIDYSESNFIYLDIGSAYFKLFNLNTWLVSKKLI